MPAALLLRHRLCFFLFLDSPRQTSFGSAIPGGLDDLCPLLRDSRRSKNLNFATIRPWGCSRPQTLELNATRKVLRIARTSVIWHFALHLRQVSCEIAEETVVWLPKRVIRRHGSGRRGSRKQTKESCCVTSHSSELPS